MNLNTIRQIRHQIWQCFSRSADALFELADALTGEVAARSLPELSLSASFRRKWSSVYEALSDGQIDMQRWSRIWTAALLGSHEGPVWLCAVYCNRGMNMNAILSVEKVRGRA